MRKSRFSETEIGSTVWSLWNSNEPLHLTILT